MNPDTPSPARLRMLLGWALVAISLAYAGLIHHGVGTPGSGAIRHWWQPRGLFFTWESFDSLLAQPPLATLALAIPAFAFVVAVAVVSRSAIAATLSLAAALFAVLCCFYGLGEGRRAVWGFFGWRGSGVMALFSLALAAAALAPFLARRWLGLAWPARLIVYAPVAAAVTVAIRDVTGTDPALPFAISPWPVVSMFGLELGATGIAALFAMAGLDLAAVVLIRQRRLPGALACAALGLAIPVAIFGLGLGVGTSALALVVAAAATALWAIRDSEPQDDVASILHPAAHSVTLGAALVALPILGGQLLVAYDYDVTRNARAQQILDALDRYHARESTYPDALDELVASKDLDLIPVPQIGFGVLEEPQFVYQNFGTNYLLEFSAPRWVQCAYNPPYPEDEDSGSAATGSDDPEETEDEGTGSWSCPQKPPELW